jgi:electron transfer flavoprotein alpha subunit
VDAEHLAAPLAVNWAPEVVALAADYSHVFGPSTTLGRDLMPRVSALLGVNQVSDIMEVIAPNTFKRPIYAGNAIIDVQCAEGQIIVGTVRNASWQAVDASGSGVVEQKPAAGAAAVHSRYVGLEAGGGERPDLQSAARVISGGRALASEENFEMIYRLADKLGAGAPDLYIAFGISGAIQHITGIKDAGTIVAINKDSEAPIFEVSDIGLVADLFKVIPEIESLLG